MTATLSWSRRETSKSQTNSWSMTGLSPTITTSSSATESSLMYQVPQKLVTCRDGSSTTFTSPYKTPYMHIIVRCRISARSIRLISDDISPIGEPQPADIAHLLAAEVCWGGGPKGLESAGRRPGSALGLAHRQCLRGKRPRRQCEDPVACLCLLVSVVQLPEDVRYVILVCVCVVKLYLYQ